MTGRTIRSALEDIRQHLLVAVLGTDMCLGGKEELDVIIRSIQDRREF
jgi:hypothetical protein